MSAKELQEVADRIRNRPGMDSPYIDADDPNEICLDGWFSIEELAALVDAYRIPHIETGN